MGSDVDDRGAGRAGRPVIGICTALERAGWSVWDQTAALLPELYIEATQRAGAMVLMLPPDGHLVDDPSQALDVIDGLMLAGGVDIDPEIYGAEADPATAEVVPERDAFEIALAREAVARDMPVLGICRGAQLINVALGGSLIQDLPDHIGRDRHLRELGIFADHSVRLAEGSLAARVVGGSEHMTKSHHHQGVGKVGEGLVVSGVAEFDGLPEALEMPGKRFVLGVQWHPEADEGSPVIAALVDAARSFSDGRASLDEAGMAGARE